MKEYKVYLIGNIIHIILFTLLFLLGLILLIFSYFFGILENDYIYVVYLIMIGILFIQMAVSNIRQISLSVRKIKIEDKCLSLIYKNGKEESFTPVLISFSTLLIPNFVLKLNDNKIFYGSILNLQNYQDFFYNHLTKIDLSKPYLKYLKAGSTKATKKMKIASFIIISTISLALLTWIVLIMKSSFSYFGSHFYKDDPYFIIVISLLLIPLLISWWLYFSLAKKRKIQLLFSKSKK